MNGSDAAFKAFLEDHYFPRSGMLLYAMGNVLIAFAFTFTLWQSSNKSQWVLWVGLIIVFTVISLFYKVRQKSKTSSDRKTIITLDVLIGGIWLLGVIFSNSQLQSEFHVFAVLLLCAVAILSAFNLYNFLPSSLGTIGLGLPVLAVVLWTGGGQRALTFLCVLIWMLALILALGLHRSFVTRLKLVFEKNLLLQNIEDKIIELEALRKTEAQARREAETANRAKSRFLAHSSHDLRQPLHAMGLLLETMPEKGLSKRAKHILGRVKQSQDNLSGLFDSLLDVALLDTGQVTVNNSVFSLGQILKQIAQDYKELAQSYDVVLSYVPSTAYIRSDPVIVHRMIQNLVSNAIKHAGPGRVLIGVRRQDKTLSVAIYDAGKGISEADQSRIFEEFTKLTDKEDEERVPGLGLGLSIVKRLAIIIDAEIRVKSQTGKGSVFFITGLKPDEMPDTSHSGKLDFDNDTSAKNVRIAIIDDEKDVLKATQRIVMKWGFTADLYLIGEVESIKKPDVVLCDYQLGGDRNGIDVIGDIRKFHQDNIPAILVTANTSNEVSDRAAELKLPVLYKPVKPAQLRSLLLATLAEKG